MAERDSINSTLKVVAPILLAVISLIGVVVQTDWFAALVAPDPVPVATVVVTQIVGEPPTPEDVETEPVAEEATVTEEATATEEAIATATPVPLPLVEVFPQVGLGKDFDYINSPATFSAEITNGNCVHSGVYGLKMTYAIKNSGSAGWGVLWVDTPDNSIDFLGHDELVFWVKGGAGSERFKVTMSDSLQQTKGLDSSSLLVLSRDWQEVRVPLENFGSVNLGLLTSLTFDVSIKNTGGQLCIDDISFE